MLDCTLNASRLYRGGIPVCFPQFGGFGPLSQHGFARNSAWSVASSSASSVTLLLQPSEEQLKLFPHPFELRAKACTLPEALCRSMACTEAGTERCPPQVEVDDGALTQSLEATNTGQEPFELTAALHTYVAVLTIDKARPACLLQLHAPPLRTAASEGSLRGKILLAGARGRAAGDDLHG
jgi:glucose-6-phosphate 1-epimerase